MAATAGVGGGEVEGVGFRPSYNTKGFPSRVHRPTTHLDNPQHPIKLTMQSGKLVEEDGVTHACVRACVHAPHQPGTAQQHRSIAASAQGSLRLVLFLTTRVSPPTGGHAQSGLRMPIDLIQI